ncbi:major facilitator superfamily transporter [Hypoxylon cercidicola]|nr:major facilitator superfamily transporter [Hypoxylon cercidicola]
MNVPSSKTTNKNGDVHVLVLDSSASKLHLEADNLELSSLHFCLLSIGLLTGLFLSLLDTSIVATSLFKIGTELDALGSVNWIALAYSLAYLGFAVLLCQISDIIGRRKAFTASYVVFIVSSIACGFARNLNQLIAFRAMQGLGGSGLYSLTMIIIREVSPRKLGRYIGGIIGIVVTLSSVFGPVLGGALTHYASWRWVFWINGPVGVASVFLFYVLWPKHQALLSLGRRSWKTLDYIGSILLITGTVLVVFPFQNAGSKPNQWSKAIFIAPLAVGAASWLGLFIWSIFVERSRKETIYAALPMRLMRDRVYVGVVLNTMCLGFPCMLIIYAFPLRLQMVNGKDALTAGLMLLPVLGPSALGSLIAGMLNGKNRIFEMLLIGSCLMVLGCGLLSTLSSTYEIEAKALWFLVFVGLGFGISLATATIAATTHSSLRDRAPAQGIMAQARVLGGSLGIATFSAILGKGNAAPTENQQTATRQTYSDAFNECMRSEADGPAKMWRAAHERRE